MGPQSDLALNETRKRNNALGYALLNASDVLRAGGLVSPLSITTTLAMLAGGGDEQTKRVFCKNLGVDSVDELSMTVHPMLHTESTVLSGGNAVYAESNYRFYPAFESHVAALEASIDTSFAKLEDAEDAINSWVSKKTDGMIPRLVDGNALRGNHLVLLNALSFKAEWETPFNPKQTRQNEPFHDSPNRKSVDLMTRSRATILLSETSTYTAVSLPYKNGFNLTAYLPTAGHSVTSLLPVLQNELAPAFKEEQVALLAIPSFAFDSKVELKAILTTLGFPLSDRFAAMGEGPNLVNAILHSTKIQVDEAGTTAAAATAVMMTRSLPSGPEIIFDRPFVYTITDKDQTSIFTGIFS